MDDVIWIYRQMIRYFAYVIIYSMVWRSPWAIFQLKYLGKLCEHIKICGVKIEFIINYFIYAFY